MSDSATRVSIEYRFFGEGWRAPVPIGPGRALPADYIATIDDPDLPFLVKLRVSVGKGGRAQVDGVELARRESDDPSITARTLRDVPLGRFLEASVLAAQLKVEETSPGSYQIRPLRDAELVDAESAASSRAARRRTRTDPDTDPEIAARWREEALQDEEWRRKPTLYVAERMNVSRATAARLLRRAREGRK